MHLLRKVLRCYLQYYYKFPNVVSSIAIAENAAEQLRKIWNLGYDPIPDVVEMLEDKGYRVVEIEAPASFDGMKAQIDQKKRYRSS